MVFFGYTTVLVQTSTQALSPSTAVLYQHSPVSESTEYHTSQNESKAQVQQQTTQISNEPIQLQRFVKKYFVFVLFLTQKKYNKIFAKKLIEL